MRYKQFGKTDMNVSVATVGTWAIGAQGWGDVDKNESIAAIRTMIENGVNVIDTAPVYGRGHSEEVVGEAIRGMDRSKLYLSTKVGLTWTSETGPIVKNASYDSILKECDDSLKRLGTDYIDLYIVHLSLIHI